MRTGQLLRLYANPVKPFLLLLVAAGVTLIGLLMLQDSKTHASAFDTAKAYAVIVFFGLGTVVFLVMILVYVFVRRPVLQIDGQGWSYRPPLLAGAQTVEWPNIAHVAVCRQKLPRGGSMYYLVVHARDPHRLPRPRVRAFTARFYPSLWGAAMSVPLNYMFLRTTPAKSRQLLGRILTTCAYEMQFYGVQVSSEIHDL